MNSGQQQQQSEQLCLATHRINGVPPTVETVTEEWTKCDCQRIEYRKEPCPCPTRKWELKSRPVE